MISMLCCYYSDLSSQVHTFAPVSCSRTNWNEAIVIIKLCPRCTTHNGCFRSLSLGKIWLKSRLLCLLYYIAAEQKWWAIGPLYENMSSTKPEVHNVAKHCQRRTDPQPQATCIKFSEVFFSFTSYASGQTNGHTDHNILRTHIRGEVIIQLYIQ